MQALRLRCLLRHKIRLVQQAKDFSTSSSVAVPSTLLAVAAAAGSGRSGVAHSAKPEVTEVAMTGMPDAAAASQKPGVNLEATASALPVGDGSGGNIGSG